jgi:hypothetical protein
MGTVVYLGIQVLHLCNNLRCRNSRSRHQSPNNTPKEHRVLAVLTVRSVPIAVGEHLGLTSLKIHCYFQYQML